MSKLRISRMTCHALVLLLALLPAIGAARPAAGQADEQIYIIQLQDPPLAVYDGRALSAPLADGRSSLKATQADKRGQGRLDTKSAESLAYLDYLENRHQSFQLEASVALARQVQPERRYRFATNGMAVRLTAAEAEILATLPAVKRIHPDRKHKLLTDAGPTWIGANHIWDGQTSSGDALGEGIVVGLIDSGINWEHPSFADVGGDGYNHSNPWGSQRGLCSMPSVECNDKLIGVFDFVEDNPGTNDIVEENTDGRDNSGHGSHVAGAAVGNFVGVDISGAFTDLSGVAPHANLVSFRVCYVGEPLDPEGGGCQGSAILDAIDEAIDLGVDVINYSIGTNAFDPWAGGTTPTAFLNARNAGIFVATSAGNEGPNPGTIGSPANAPWVVSVGNATHDRVFGSVVENLSGGSAPSPGDLIGASLSDGINVRPIVHAADYGFALCGTGPAELEASCAENTGASNPWAGNPVFNGEIVVCDRGTYGRIEKGKNVMLAGAGGYILANTANEGEAIVADDHCLPATHLGRTNADALRHWLNFGSGHEGSLSGFGLAHGSEFADQLSATSSRGPVEPPVEDILKPNVIAPGTDIISAWYEGTDFVLLSGTSMSSPHIAGAAALLKSLHPDWTPSQIASAIETTSTAALATTETGTVAGPHERGAGRPQLGEAADAGLYLNVTGAEFEAADPLIGGDPKELNLFGLADSSCRGTCAFTRSVTDMVGGASWQTTALGFPAGVDVTIQPANFTLANGATRSLDISLDLRGSDRVGQWVYGQIRLRSGGLPDQFLTVAVFYDGGALPDEWTINSEEDAGRMDVTLAGLVELPDATFTSGGLVRPTVTVETIIQDPTSTDPTTQNEDPFDGGDGTFTVWHEVPEGALWLHAETLASTSNDLDLFVGRDDNQNGITEDFELVCQSITPTDRELCDLFTPSAGDYWIIVQNWDTDNEQGDEATLISAVVGADDASDLVVSGPGIAAALDDLDLRLSWSNIDAVDGETLYGAVGLGTNRNDPNNVGVVPVVFNRTAIGAPETLPLMAGREHQFALAGDTSHDRAFIDIPAGVTVMDVEVRGRGSQQNNNLSVALYRQNYPGALNNPPFDVLPGAASLITSANGGGGAGPRFTINNGVEPGRYFLEVSNNRSAASSVTVQVDLQTEASTLAPHKGLWDFTRPIFQGAEWNSSGDFSFLVWYAYGFDGQPTWYIASGPSPQGNIWVADLLRVTNDGADQQEKQVGVVSITFLSEDEVIFSYALLGDAGFDPLHPNGPNTCPEQAPQSVTGHWFRGVPGLGGSTVLRYEAAQAQVHYLFDASGNPRWIIAADDGNQSATAPEIPLLQFDGFCAVCSSEEVTWQTVGMVTRGFDSETEGSWTLDFVLEPPLVQSIDRTDSIVKLSDTLACD